MLASGLRCFHVALLMCILGSFADTDHDLFSYMRAEGEDVHVHIADTAKASLTATRDFSAGEVVLRVRVRSSLYAGNPPDIVRGLCGIGRGQSSDTCPDYSRLILIVAAERRHPRSMFRNYFERLEQMIDVGIPSFSKDFGKPYMQLLNVIDGSNKTSTSNIAESIHAAVRAGKKLAPPLSEDEAHWALFVVRTRSFVSSIHGRTLSPGFDFVKYVLDNPNVSPPSCGEVWCECKALRDIYAGDHLSTEYGRYSNAVLFANYGFVDFANKWGPYLKTLLPESWRAGKVSHKVAWLHPYVCSTYTLQNGVQLQDDPSAPGFVLPEDVRCVFIAHRWQFTVKLPKNLLECLRNPLCEKWGEPAITHKRIASACAARLGEYAGTLNTIKQLRKNQNKLSEQLLAAVESEVFMLHNCTEEHETIYRRLTDNDRLKELPNGFFSDMRGDGDKLGFQLGPARIPSENLPNNVSSDSTLRGLVSVRSFVAGEVVLRVRIRSMLHEGTSLASVQGLCGIGEGSPASNACPEYSKMILVLAAEMRHPREMFRAYLGSLQDEEEFGFYSFSKDFGIPHTHILKAVDPAFFASKEQVDSVKAALRAGSALDPPLSVGEAHWALFTLRRRAFSMPGHGIVLMPGIDLVNHASHNAGVTYPICGMEWCEIKAIMPLPAGKLLFMDYGFANICRSNVVFLASRGFVDTKGGPCLRELRPKESHARDAPQICSSDIITNGIQLQANPRAQGFVLPEDVRCLYIAEVWKSAKPLPEDMLNCLEDITCTKWGEASITHKRIAAACSKNLKAYDSASPAMEQLRGKQDKLSVQLVATVKSEMNMLRKCKAVHAAIYKRRVQKQKEL